MHVLSTGLKSVVGLCFGFLLLFSTLSYAAGRDFFVDADWLAEQLASEKPPIVLEVRYHPHRYFTVGHIPSAIQVQRFKDLGDNNGNPIMRLPSKEAFEQTLQRWGVNNDSTLVLYDDASTALAARLYALLALYGFDMNQVKILQGGTVEWTGFNELTKAATPVPSLGTVTLTAMQPDWVVEWTDVYDRVVAQRDETIVLVDARPHDMYTGDVIRHAVQGGHIPGAINIVGLDAIDGQTQQWRSEETLAALYKAIPKNKTVYLYCHDGFRMSLAWLQLKSLGYEHLRFLNGGWAAWDKALTLPIVRGEEPYDDDFKL